MEINIYIPGQILHDVHINNNLYLQLNMSDIYLHTLNIFYISQYIYLTAHILQLTTLFGHVCFKGTMLVKM